MTRYRIAFVFAETADVGLDALAGVLRDKGERTFEIQDEERWFHKRYQSEVNWRHDLDNNMTASVDGGEAVRTCGSLVEWTLRNVALYLDDASRDLKGVSVF